MARDTSLWLERASARLAVESISDTRRRPEGNKMLMSDTGSGTCVDQQYYVMPFFFWFSPRHKSDVSLTRMNFFGKCFSEV